jgi:hypothetical protein
MRPGQWVDWRKINRCFRVPPLSGDKKVGWSEMNGKKNIHLAGKDNIITLA